MTGGTACGIIYPNSKNESCSSGKLNSEKLNPYKDFYDDTVKLYKLPLCIPASNDKDYGSYCEEIEKSIKNWKEDFQNNFSET